MIRIILILLLVTYLSWVAYRFFSNNEKNRKKTNYNFILPLICLVILVGGVYFLLPKLAVIFQKFLPFATSPLGIFQVLVQKLLPIINTIRGILPI